MLIDAVLDASNKAQFDSRGGALVFSSVTEVFAVGVSVASSTSATALEWLTDRNSANLLRIGDVSTLASRTGVTQVANLSVCSAP
jgi:hypothetical protein